jgi:hypothetical protein
LLTILLATRATKPANLGIIWVPLSCNQLSHASKTDFAKMTFKGMGNNRVKEKISIPSVSFAFSRNRMAKKPNK